MKFGIISDTHDHLNAITRAIEIFRAHKVDRILHCGDWVSPYSLGHFGALMADWNIPVMSVLGNNEGDYRKIEKINSSLKNPVVFCDVSILQFAVDDNRYAVYHGHDKPTLNALIRSKEYRAVFTGHTHVVRNEMAGKTLVLNPGSTSYFSDGKIVDVATVAVYDTSKNSAEIVLFK